MEATCNHQVHHQPEIVVEANGNALADAEQFADGASFHLLDGRLRRAQQEWTCNAHSLKLLPDDALLKRADISQDIGQLRHSVQKWN